MAKCIYCGRFVHWIFTFWNYDLHYNSGQRYQMPNGRIENMDCWVYYHKSCIKKYGKRLQ